MRFDFVGSDFERSDPIRSDCNGWFLAVGMRAGPGLEGEGCEHARTHASPKQYARGQLGRTREVDSMRARQSIQAGNLRC